MPVTVGVPLIVTVLLFHTPVTPVGKPVTVAPVAPVVEYVMLVIALPIHTDCDDVDDPLVNDMVLPEVTTIRPVAVFVPPVHPPVIVTVKLNVPLAVGVPLIVMVLLLHDPVTPDGRPEKVAPVAPVVVYVMLVMALPKQIDCDIVDDALVRVIVLVGLTVIVPDAVFVPPSQPPDKVI